jgi:DNA-binding transcriptional regulator YiaG
VLTPRLSEQDLERAPVLSEEAAIATAQAALVHASVLGHHLRTDQGAPSSQVDFSGKMLCSLRESRGLSLHELADRTRISVKHLENIEADRYQALPATVYLRGILRSLARELKLDPVRVSSSYIALASEAKARRTKR